MIQNKLAGLTDEELIQRAKKIKSSKIFDAAIIGLLIGVSFYSTIKNGFGLLTFLPVVYIPVAAKNKAINKELEALLKERNLNQ
ncbi:hypothetical protein [Pedobacter sp.]|uniref:hypothetical protein n=1 Tax=Pedobacter sp. TaxID=1411316 RepID=UPI00396CD06F